MDDAHLPVRGVAEYAYCPRLFYYMAIEGIFAPSADTELGAATHRRVDRPSEEPVEDDRPKAVRSLALTSDRLGITGTLDLAAIEGRTAVPIEYRKGRPQRQRLVREAVDEMLEDPELPAAPEAWPTDRIQLCLQAMLLEEAGYEVREGVLYYAAEKLRLTVPISDALRDEALRTVEDARRCASGARPLPLVNDPKCPRCSLHPICLPDEIHQQRTVALTVGGRDAEVSPPRRMWPPRTDGIQLVLQRDAVRVGVRGESLRVTDRDGTLVRELPIATVESLAIVGGVQVSTQALAVLVDHDVPIAFMSGAGRVTAMVDPLGPVSARLRRAQVLRLESDAVRLALAKALVVAKIENQRTLLRRNHATVAEDVLRDLAHSAEAARRARTIDELRGHEGNAARAYFAHFPGMFKGEAVAPAQEFDQNGRQRRPPPDPINAVLSFGYSMLTHECTTACRIAGLEPTIGALHSTRPGRPALALDLMEPFRPLIADSVAIATFNRGELTTGHFLRTAAGCALTEYGRRAFFDAHGRRLDTEVTHASFGYRLCYRRMLTLHARMVAAWLLEEIPTLDFLTTR